MLKRTLVLDLPKRQSLFLWGARKTGKSTYLKDKFPNSLYIDLLDHNTFLRYSKSVTILKDEIIATNPSMVIIDEVQKIPEILDEVHHIIEEI